MTKVRFHSMLHQTGLWLRLHASRRGSGARGAAAVWRPVLQEGLLRWRAAVLCQAAAGGRDYRCCSDDSLTSRRSCFILWVFWHKYLQRRKKNNREPKNRKRLRRKSLKSSEMSRFLLNEKKSKSRNKDLKNDQKKWNTFQGNVLQPIISLFLSLWDLL